MAVRGGAARSSPRTNTPLQTRGQDRGGVVTMRAKPSAHDRRCTARRVPISAGDSGRGSVATKSMSLRPGRNAPSAMEPTT